MRKSRVCHSAQATWLEGAHTSPLSPGLGCTHTHAHSHSHTRVGPQPWGGTGGIPPCQTISPDHKVTTWTDNRLTNVYFSKKKNFFKVYSSCPGWLHAFNPHRNPARLVILVSSFQAGQQGPEGSCAFSKFQGWGGPGRTAWESMFPTMVSFASCSQFLYNFSY